MHDNDSLLNSYLSFRPLLAVLRQNMTNGHPGMQKLYSQVLEKVESVPELNETITDLSLLKKHSELIEELLSAVFPPTTANYMYGVAIPFKLKTVFSSPLFKTILLKPGTNEITVPDVATAATLGIEKNYFAYGLILKKYLGFNNPENAKSVYPFVDTATGLTRFMELRLDGRFIDVNPIDKMPTLPESILDPHTNRLLTIQELMELVPIEKFVFEGITPIRVNDVTESAIVAEIKNSLLEIKSMTDQEDFKVIERYIQSLIGLKGASIGITPFFKVNGHYIYSDLHNSTSLLFKNMDTIASKDEISDYCKLLFKENNQPVLYGTLDEQVILETQCLQYYYKGAVRSLILCPLKQKDELIGMLEITAEMPGQLTTSHLSKLEAIIPLFILRLEKTLEKLNNQIDRVIKMRFTAVQPAVEWKFTEAALNFIVKKQKRDDVKIERIAFHHVYPLYGVIDVRGSSTERSKAIQKDMLQQLELAKKIVTEAQQSVSFPLLQEIEFKINRYINATSVVLQSEEEVSINDFLQNQVLGVFKHLGASQPGLREKIDAYFAELDPGLKMIYHYRKKYEESISKINETLSHFIDKEQVAAQKVYPHYFERYVTDGLDFNIFIGQSISPRKKFDEIYLRNMKMWQLTVLTKAAILLHEQENELPHLLRTTQLILSHNQPLSISFRTEERKFDVDGAYNTRYEIVKKRIDKVKIKETNERLTQPGKIAIVYSQSKDAEEYTEYIEFLQNKKLLKPGIEKHDLEELQGVIGLRALRVGICFNPGEPQSSNGVELSAITSQQLLDE